MAATVVIQSQDNYGIGDSLNLQLERRSSPFTSESIEEFAKAFTAREEKRDDAEKGPSTGATFKHSIEVVRTNKDFMKNLDVEGSLSASYGPISGDANIKFAQKNTMSDLDIALVVTAKQDDLIVKCDQVDFNKLQLRNSVSTQIKAGKLNISQFKEKYGAYFIIGFEYGGHFTFISKTTVSSQHDKTAFDGSLSIKLAKVGLKIGGKAKGSYNEEDLRETAQTKNTLDLHPNVNSPLVYGDDGILQLLQVMADPTEKEIQEDFNARRELVKRASKLFSSISKRVKAIVIAIDTIQCVDEAYNDLSQQRINVFFAYANPLYFNLCSMVESLSMFKKNLMEYDEEYKGMKEVLKQWRHKLDPMKEFYGALGVSLDMLIAASAVYVDKSLGKDVQKDDKEKMANWKYIGIDGEDLMDEFREEIIVPYNKLMDKIWKQKQTEQKEEELELKTAEELNEVKLQLRAIEAELDGVKSGDVELCDGWSLRKEVAVPAPAKWFKFGKFVKLQGAVEMRPQDNQIALRRYRQCEDAFARGIARMREEQKEPSEGYSALVRLQVAKLPAEIRPQYDIELDGHVTVQADGQIIQSMCGSHFSVIMENLMVAYFDNIFFCTGK